MGELEAKEMEKTEIKDKKVGTGKDCTRWILDGIFP